MDDIFVSYAREDRGRVETLVKALETRGWRVWWDREIVAGQSFDQTIETALTTARCVIVVWSADSVASHWVRAEASTARELDKLIPVRISAVPPPLEFRMLQTVDLIDGSGDETAGMDRLVQAIERRARGSVSRAPMAPRVAAKRHQWSSYTMGGIGTALLVIGSFLWVNGSNETTLSALLRMSEAQSEPVDVNAALVLAAQGGATDTVRALLDRGTDVDAKDRLGDSSALVRAIAAEQTETALLLLDRGARANGTNRESVPGTGDTALALAIIRQNAAIVRALLDKGADVDTAGGQNRMTPLMYAVEKESVEIVTELLRRKPDLEIRDKIGKTALIVAAGAALPVNHIPALLENGPDLEAVDNRGRTALMWAASRGSSGRVQALAEAGAALDRADTEGWTALMFAAQHAQPDAARVLLAKGADPSIRSKSGANALQIATRSDLIATIRELLQHGADPASGG